MSKLIDLTGQSFGRLLVLNRAEDHVCPSGYKNVQWLCKCECGKEAVVSGKALRKGTTQSCGCLASEIISRCHKKYNEYDLDSEEYGIGYTSNTNKAFYFDKEDYDKIKGYCWRESNKGYVESSKHVAVKNEFGDTKNRQIFLHRLVTNPPDGVFVDHIKHNKFDNRKSMLRFVTKPQNAMNAEPPKNNTSGIVGVCWHSRDKVWQARIKVNYKYIHLGYFDNFEDAVKARKSAEEKYFGDYSYDNSIKKGAS